MNPMVLLLSSLITAHYKVMLSINLLIEVMINEGPSSFEE